MKCQNCGAEINENAKFCSKCGAKVEIITNSQNELANEKVCPKCGQRYPSNIKFCMKDGTPLQDKIETKSSISYQESADKKTYSQPVPSTKSSKQIIWILIVLVIVVSAGIGGYFLYSNIISKKQETPVKETQKQEDITTQTGQPQEQKEKNLQEGGDSNITDKVTENKEETKEESVKTSKSSVTEAEKITTKKTNHTEVLSNLKKIDPFKLEENINRSLRDAGLENVYAQVNDNLEVTLKGTVSSRSEKERAFAIAKNFKEVKILKDAIFIVE